jgi:peptidyl-dipeptidase Dcp
MNNLGAIEWIVFTFNAPLRGPFMKHILLFCLCMTMTVLSHAQPSNPLLAPWAGPYKGVPPFDQVKIEDFKPAIEAAIVENQEEIDKIAQNPEAPNFENTLEALEKAGKTLGRVLSLYYIWQSNMNTDIFGHVEKEMEPKIAAFQDKVIQNTALFERIKAVYQSNELKKHSPEQQRLASRYYLSFVLAGAELDTVSKRKVAEINQQLAGLYTKFNQNQLADEKDTYLELKNEADLDGLPQAFKEAAAATALAKKKQGWVIANTRSSMDPFLTYSNRRDLREQAFELFIHRGDNNDAHDNKAIITEIVQLRLRRARLLGFPTHAHLRLANTMAQKPEKALQLMEQVWPLAIARVKEEVADMQKLAEKEGAKIQIAPWDYRYYAEKVRKARYDLDQAEVKNYLQLEKLREGMFWVAGELFHFEFTPVTDVPVYHPDVRVWLVTDKSSHKQIGLWYFDPYAREGKRSGAWMNSYREQEKLSGDIPTIVSNNSNFVPGKPGEPILISWDDARTLFHEFGHALHGLCSQVTYPFLSGTSVPRDYVEFPSQLMEHWLSTPEVLKRFALHYQTGEPIPQILVDRIAHSSHFNQGFSTTEYLSSALVDMKLHLSTANTIDPAEFEKKTLAELHMPKEIVMRHRLPQFGHLFSGDAYSAGYYSYLWSDVLSADAYEAFTEANGPYDSTVAKHLYQYVFSVGNTIDPAEGYRLFRGHYPKVDALMKARGFPLPKKKGKK